MLQRPTLRYRTCYKALQCISLFMIFANLALAQSELTDPISKQAAVLEAELGKYKSTAPEAAEAMVKLVELYHADGRLFGLVQAGQNFSASHPSDPRHKAVMLKWIDGLAALSRDQEVAATIRQFIARYPNAGEIAMLEVRMADALRQLPDKGQAADASRAVWRRQGVNEVGRKYGVLAIQLYDQINHHEGFVAEAELCEEMLDKLPAGEFAREVGWQAFATYRRIGQWAKSLSVGNKLLQRGLEVNPESLRKLHVEMADNSANLGQHANAAESYAQARKIRDDAQLHLQELVRRYSAGAKPAELEPLMREYGKKYPERPDRLHGVSYVALSCIANGDKARGLQLLSLVLADDPQTNSNASVFVRENGDEPDKLAESERKLLDAISKNKPGAHYLRYVLAIELYRDRLKDIEKAKQATRDFLQQSPSDDWYTSGAADWLLSASGDEDFQRNVTEVLEARRTFPQNASLRNALKNWVQNARNHKELAQRVAFANQELQKSDADPIIKAFIDQRDNRHGPGEAIRAKLLEPATLNTLHESAARYVLQTQAEWFRHYAQGNRRAESIKVYRQFAEKFPQDRQVAWWWLESATDFGQPDDMKPAAEHWLQFQPDSSYPDHWRRLLIAAERNNDANLARNSWNWMLQAQQKYGPSASYAGGIGDMLLKLGLESEAIAHWKAAIAADPQNYEARECASRLLSRITESPARVAFIVELFKQDSDYQGRYAQWLVDEFIKSGDWNNVVRVIDETRKRHQERPLRWGDFDVNHIASWVDQIHNQKELDAGIKKTVLEAIRNLSLQPAATIAQFALSDGAPPASGAKTTRLLELAQATINVGNEWYDWDRLMPTAQSFLGKRNTCQQRYLHQACSRTYPTLMSHEKKLLVNWSLSRLRKWAASVSPSMTPVRSRRCFKRLCTCDLVMNRSRSRLTWLTRNCLQRTEINCHLIY